MSDSGMSEKESWRIKVLNRTKILNRTKLLNISKQLSLWGFGILIIIMMTATVLEKIIEPSFAISYIYNSVFFVCAWIITVASSFVYIILSRLYLRKPTFMLHLAFVVILTGALVTFISGRRGTLHIRMDNKAVSAYNLNDTETVRFPFSVELENFTVEYYPGTLSPMDYVSSIIIYDNEDVVRGTVAMNRIFEYRNYRFYQTAFDADKNGVTLTVCFDPAGIFITYTGYVFLLLGMLLFFAEKKTLFRYLLKKASDNCKVILFVLLSVTGVNAANSSVSHPVLSSVSHPALSSVSHPVPSSLNSHKSALPEYVASSFGQLYVYYNGRICPMQTLANDFILKIYGRKTFEGLSAAQFLTSWFFYYDSWQDEPCIKISGRYVKHVLGTEGDYAKLSDFTGIGSFKIDEALNNGTLSREERRSLEEANEKFNLISMVCTGSILKIYPVFDKNNNTYVWYSLSDNLPPSVDDDKWRFIRYSMNYVAAKVGEKNFHEVDGLISKIRKYQKKEASGSLPSDFRIKSEIIYDSLPDTRFIFICSLIVGFCGYVYQNRLIYRRSSTDTKVNRLLYWAMLPLLLYLIFIISLRGLISGHIPLSNGFETMQFMAFAVVGFTLLARRLMYNYTSLGYIICGLAMLVASLGQSNPSITPLMPVLTSPLLSIHVVTIMIAYSVFAVIMLNGISAEILYRTDREKTKNEIRRLELTSKLLLYPGVFLLTAGIFIGAVWANVSWGRYWGWDPKEVWALITMLIYSSAIHSRSIPAFADSMFFHRFMVLAFISVIITYFGVNFVLGGMHGYA